MLNLTPKTWLAAASLLCISAAGAHAAPPNIAPEAHLTASSWHVEKVVAVNRDALPAAAADGSLETGWRPDATEAKAQWLRLDFTRPWPMGFAWTQLITRWDKPPARYRWEISRDGAHWHTLAARTSARPVDTVPVQGTGSYLRLVVPGGTTATLLEVEAYSSSGVAGRLPAPTVGFSGNQAHVAWDPGLMHNVLYYKAYRIARLSASENGSSGNLNITAVLAKGKLTQVDDRVEFPSPAIPFVYAWSIEAHGPNGEVVTSPLSEAFEVTLRSPRPFALRGMVEGYYGPVYTERERQDMVRFIGNHGGNYYLYGPKLDPYHRAKWRTPYPAEFTKAFADLVAVGESHGVRVSWALSPGLDYDGSDADKDLAVAKYMKLYDAGVRWFGLFMDDIPEAPGTVAGLKHVALANHILAALRTRDPEARLLFAPTVYSGEATALSQSHIDYLEALKGLEASMLVFWTGTGVFSPTVTHAQVDAIATLTGHSLVIWDNYPVNDLFLARRIHMGPLLGRESILGNLMGETVPVAGMLANPMWQAPLNRIPLTTALDYMRDPADYVAASSWQSAIAAEVPVENQALFKRWLASFTSNPLVGMSETSGTRTVNQAALALSNKQSVAPDFLMHAAALYAAEPKLRTLTNTDLAGALLPLARKTSALGEAELLAWQYVQGDEKAADKAAEKLATAKGSPVLLNEGLDEEWITQALKGKAGTPQGPRISNRLPSTVQVGSAVSLRFALDGATSATVVGPSGATLNRSGQFHWTPGRTGTERWVIVATNAKGSSAIYGETTVLEQPESNAGGCMGAPVSSLLLPLALPFAIAAGRAFRRRVRSTTGKP